MQVLFESRDPQAASLRDLAVHRLQLVLRRLRLLVSRARLRLSDINGPRGGVDKRCQVELTTHTVGTVVIASLADDWRCALDRSLSRATRLLTRSLQRSQKPMRGRTAKLALDSSTL